MAVDPLQHVRPNQPIKPVRAETWNAFIDAARAHKGRALGDLGGPASPVPITPSLTAVVRNGTGGTLAATFSVLKLSDVEVDPSTLPLEFLARPVFEGTTPDADDNPIAIVTGTVGDGLFVQGVVAGLAVVNVEISDAAHKWAKPISGNSNKLASGSTGPARILWKEGSTGLQRCVVNLLDGSGGISAGGGGADPDADATTRGYVGIDTGVDQVLGDGDKTFQRGLTTNSAGTAQYPLFSTSSAPGLAASFSVESITTGSAYQTVVRIGEESYDEATGVPSVLYLAGNINAGSALELSDFDDSKAAVANYAYANLYTKTGYSPGGSDLGGVFFRTTGTASGLGIYGDTANATPRLIVSEGAVLSMLRSGVIYDGIDDTLRPGAVVKGGVVVDRGALAIAVADATGAGDVVAQLNALLASLRAADILDT